MSPELSPPVLRDAGCTGLRTIAPQQRGALLEAAREAGLRCLKIELAGCNDKAKFLARMAAALEFPPCFGQNWDALEDCLGDLAWLPAAGYLLLLEHAADLRDAAPDDYQTAVDILAEAVETWRERGIPFWVFVADKKDDA